MSNSPTESTPAPPPARPRPDLHAVATDPAAMPPAQARRRAKAAAVPAPAEVPTQQPARAVHVAPARMKARHYLALGTFLLFVLLPFVTATAYLYTRAADQYHSDVAFSIRSEQMAGGPASLLGAITSIGGGGGASDANVVNEYIHSQKIVELIDARINLREIYTKAPDDFYFRLGDDPEIEHLLSYWNSMIDVSFDSTTGIIHVRANAFTPEDARRITEEILTESSTLVNRLSDQARADAIRFASQDLAEAEANLRAARQRMADFRHEYRLVDPAADVRGQSGLLNSLQGELARAMVDRDELLSFAAEDDQRVVQANRRIEAITRRIDEERDSLGLKGVEGTLPEVVGAYEELKLDLEFATKAYTQTLAAVTGARAEARRQSRYLAPHIQPTLAESALYPRRALLAGLTGLFLMLGWGVFMLIYYNVRDNRR